MFARHLEATIFNHVPLPPKDTIHQLIREFNEDKDERKVNLVGGNACEDLFSDGKCEFTIEQRQDNDFCEMSSELLLGSSSIALKEKRVACSDTLSGTGAFRLACELIKKLVPNTTLYISDPSWENHSAILEQVGIQHKKYAYLDRDNFTVDMDRLLHELDNAPESSIILLQLCGHNPTGIDPTRDQWATIGEIIKKRKLIPLFDCVYQGLVSGDLDTDAMAIRMFVDNLGLEVIAIQSYAKNFGVFGQGTGAIVCVCHNQDEALAVSSQLKFLKNTLYNYPTPQVTMAIGSVIHESDKLETLKQEHRNAVQRISANRSQLYNELISRSIPGNWQIILKQKGIFFYSMLTPKQVVHLREIYHIYLTNDGRMNLSSLNDSNIAYVANAIKDAVETHNDSVELSSA